MKMIRTLPTCLLFCLFAWQPVYSEPLGPENAEPELGGYSESEEWQEGEYSIPAYPDGDNLVKVAMERDITPFTYYIDPDSLSLGKDGVVRYTVVIESTTGAKNVMYEGIRCSATEYRTYAYGTTDGEMSRARVSEWKPFYDSGSMVHRYNFHRYYMCDKLRLPYKPDIIMQRIRYPEDFEEGSDYSNW